MGPNLHSPSTAPRFRDDGRPQRMSPHGRGASYNRNARDDYYFNRHSADRFNRKKRRSQSGSHSPAQLADNNSDNSDNDGYSSPHSFANTREEMPHGDKRPSPRTPNRGGMVTGNAPLFEQNLELSTNQREKENLDNGEELREREAKLLADGDSIEMKREEESLNNSIDEDSAPKEPAMYGPALPMKEDLLQQIERIDREITKVQIEIDTAKRQSQSKMTPNFESPKRKTSAPVLIKNKTHQFYFENREQARKAYELLEPFYCVQPINEQQQQPCELQIWKDNIENHIKLLPEVEKIIEERVKLEIEELKQSVRQYVTLKGRWKETLKQHKRDPVLQEILDKMNAQDDTVSLTNRVLSHISGRYVKTLATVPTMFNEEERQFVYDNINGFVEDPLLEWKERRVIEQAWSQDDKEKFVHYLGHYQKDLKSVATHFPNKTMSDIIVFYYNNKRSDMFKKVMQALKRNPTKRKIYDEGRKSVPLQSEMPRELRGFTNVSHPLGDNYLRPRSARMRIQYDESDPVILNEPRTPAEWTNAERQRFLELLPNHGRNFATIARYLKTKSSAQIKQFFNDNKESMNLELLLPKKKKPSQTKVGRPSKQPLLQMSITSSPTLQHQAITETIPSAPVTNTYHSPQASIGISEDEDNGQKRGGLARKSSKRITSTWTSGEKDTFFNLLQEFGRNWKKFVEIIPTKSETHIKAFYQQCKIKLGLATERSIKKKKKPKYLPQEITAEIVVPDLCSFASICEEIAEKGDLAVEELQGSSFLSDDSLDEDGMDDMLKRKLPIAPPIRPRMILSRPKLGAYVTRPTLKFNTMHQLMNETAEVDSKKNVNQHVLANLELLGSLAAEESSNANKIGRKNDRSRTSRTPNTPLSHNPVTTLFQQVTNNSPPCQVTAKPAPEKTQPNVVADAQKQGKETAKTLKDKFFAGSTFTAHSSFYPISQNFMLNAARIPAAPYQPTPVPQPAVVATTIANSTIQQPSMKLATQTNLTPSPNQHQQPRMVESPIVNTITIAANRASSNGNKEQLPPMDDNWLTTLGNSRSSLFPADSFGTPRNTKIPSITINSNKISPQGNKDLSKQQQQPMEFNENTPLTAFSTFISSLPEPSTVPQNDNRFPKKNKTVNVSKQRVSVEALEEGSVNVAPIHSMDGSLFSQQFLPTQLPPIIQDPGSSSVQQQQVSLSKSLFNK